MEINEAQVVELYTLGNSLRDVGMVFGVSKIKITNVLKRHGVALRSRGGPNFKAKPFSSDEVLKMHADGMSIRAIATKLGVDKVRVRKVVADAGLSRRTRSQPRQLLIGPKEQVTKDRHPWRTIGAYAPSRKPLEGPVTP